MAQSKVNQNTGHAYTLPTGSTALKYRTKNSGNPLAHNDVDANFEILRSALNGVIDDIVGVAGNTVSTNVPVNAVFTDTQLTTDQVRGKFSAGTNVGITNGVISSSFTNTTYSVGNGGLTEKNFTGALLTKLNAVATSANNYSLPVAATAIGGVKEGGDIDIDGDGIMTVKNGAIEADQIAEGAIDASKISTTINLGGGGASGFQRAATMCSPSVLTGTNGQQWVYTVNHGGTSGGVHMTMFDIDGSFIGHLFPNSAGGNSSAPSWPFHHTSSWAARWPQTWIDGGKGLDSGYAWMWVKHTGSYLFSMKLSLTTGRPYTNHGKDTNPSHQAAGDYWATEGIHAAGGNAFSDHWNIIGQDNGNIFLTYGFEATGINYANGTQCYVMSKGSYNSPYASHSYTGVQKFMPQCSAGLNGSLTGQQHNQSYIMVAGINPTSGRVYLHRKGCADVMTVMQLSQANGTGPSRWYRAWHSMLKTAADQPNTGTYHLDYVTQFAIPDAINSEGGQQSTNYQVQFTTPTTANPDAVPTYLTRGGHWGSWNYGGAQVIPWQSSWET